MRYVLKLLRSSSAFYHLFCGMMFMFLGKFSICSLVRMDRPAMFWSVVAFATLLVLKQTVFHVSIKTLH